MPAAAGRSWVILHAGACVASCRPWRSPTARCRRAGLCRLSCRSCGHLLMMVTTLHDQPNGSRARHAAQQFARAVKDDPDQIRADSDPGRMLQVPAPTQGLPTRRAAPPTIPRNNKIHQVQVSTVSEDCQQPQFVAGLVGFVHRQLGLSQQPERQAVRAGNGSGEGRRPGWCVPGSAGCGGELDGPG
jgi:hypothetical protein